MFPPPFDADDGVDDGASEVGDDGDEVTPCVPVMRGEDGVADAKAPFPSSMTV